MQTDLKQAWNELPYRVVDVFTDRQLEGNPLAVFPDASSLDPGTMQRIARELNLSETVFVLPASRQDCIARLRIFTPSKEMDFAGHPTIGTAFVLFSAMTGGPKNFALEENVGPVPVRVEEGPKPMFWLTTPPIHEGPIYDSRLCAEALGLDESDLLDIPPQCLSAGNPVIYIPLRTREAVDRASLDLPGMRRLCSGDSAPMGIFVFAPTEEGAYSRMFAPEYGIVEDPATGSATGPLAAFMMRHRLVPRTHGTRFVSEQGTRMGRRSLLHVLISRHDETDVIEVGGQVTPLIWASLRLDNDRGAS